MKTKPLLELQNSYPKVHRIFLEEITTIRDFQIVQGDLMWIQKISASVRDKKQMITDIIKIREDK